MTNSNAEYLPPGTNSKITSTKASPPTPLKISEKIEILMRIAKIIVVIRSVR